MALWVLVELKAATKAELEEYYTLDDALKLIALSQMRADIEAAAKKHRKK